jgi:hypothetical protein
MRSSFGWSVTGAALSALLACCSAIETGGGGSISTSTTTGSTGCVLAMDCLGADGECAVRACNAGVCAPLFTPAGTPITAQVPGDCRAIVCDGVGATMVVDAPNDVPDDANPCTTDQCQGGLAQHLPAPAGTVCGPGLFCDGLGACIGCWTAADCPGSDTECAARVCDGGACGVRFAPLGTALSAQIPGDCAVRTCNGNGGVALTYDAADTPPGKSCPSTTWQPPFATCGEAVEPAPATSWPDCSAAVYPGKSGGDLLWVTKTNLTNCSVGDLAVGPTGDVVVGGECYLSLSHQRFGYQRFNGSGGPVSARLIDLCPDDAQSSTTGIGGMSIEPTNDLYFDLWVTGPSTCGSGGLEVDAPNGDVIPPPPIWVSPLGPLNFASSIYDVDLGCGSLPAAPGGSTFLTRMDAARNCLYARSLPVPDLQVTMDAVGRVVVAGRAGTGAVDLGGGPLAPVGSSDILLAELDPSGNHLWSKRFGGVGTTFAEFYPGTTEDSRVSTSAAGDVYLVTRLGAAVAVHAIDFGGGAITAAARDVIVASYTPAGTHRWSRAYHFPGTLVVSAAVDGCGSLALLIPSALATACVPFHENVARFAP